MRNLSHLIGGVLLVSGTSIGAGMLALPIATGMAGFYPSVFLFVFFWIFMTFTALLMLEVNLWMDSKHNNLISMAKQTLGLPGEIISWITYLFLLYALTTAYIAGSGSIFLEVVGATLGIILPEWVGPFPLLLIFGFFVYRGTRSVDLLNRILMLGLVIAYGFLVVYLMPHVDHSKFEHLAWSSLLTAASVVATSFGYHIIIPSLMAYMEGKVSLVKWAVLIGSFIPLVVYITWEYLSLGIIPIDGEFGIVQGYTKGVHGAYLIGSLINETGISVAARIFSFFAIVTSFLGVSLSLSDFLADGFKIERKTSGRVLLFIMTFLPPLVITLVNPRAFLTALEYAGAFGVIILLGLLPALMVWAGRYHHRYYSRYKAPGGRIALILIIVISMVIIFIEIANKSSLLTL